MNIPSYVLERKKLMDDYQSVKKKFIKFSNIIKKYGYNESSNKPFLYSYKYKIIIFYFDLRITKWNLTEPVLYWHWKKFSPEDLKQKAIYFEFNRLSELSFRISCEEEREVSIIKNFDKYDVLYASEIERDFNKYNNFNIKKSEKILEDTLPAHNNVDLQTLLFKSIDTIRKDPSSLNEQYKIMTQTMQKALMFKAFCEDYKKYRHSSFLEDLIKTEKDSNVLNFLRLISNYLKMAVLYK